MKIPDHATFPKKFYKYRSLAADVDRDRLADIIMNNRMWLAAPITFNDPFDCFPTVTMDAPDSVRRAYFQNVLRRRRIPLVDRLRIQRQVMARDPVVIAAEMQKSTDEMMREVGVLSLAVSGQNVLMWSHYGDSHQGVCLQYTDFLNERSPLISALPVTYSRERPLLEVSSSAPEKLLELMFLRKADYWSYEQEWRIIERKGPGYQQIPALELAAVILGARASDATKDFIVALLSKRRKPTKLLRAQFRARSFDIDLIEERY